MNNFELQVKEFHSQSMNYVLVRKSSYLHWINNLFKITCLVQTYRLTNLAQIQASH